METYECPLGVRFKASTPEHAAARAFGGKPGDYLVTRHGLPQKARQTGSWVAWLQVTTADGTEWVGDIPIVRKGE